MSNIKYNYIIMFKNKRFLLILVLVAAAALRLYGINWDQGFHLHPDERMLIMVTEKINLFTNLNPDFFNYGSLPIYLLRIISPTGNYDSLLLVGRALSVGFDLLTIIFIYKIAHLLFKDEKVSFFSALIYALTFFAIQNSHFFVVDVFLTTFTTILIYLLLLYFKSPSVKKTVLVASVFAAMLAIKFTAIIFYPIILVVIVWKLFKNFRQLIVSLFIFHVSFVICHFLFMPYAYIDYQKFFSDVQQQLQMNSNPYIFPYTLQYVYTTPYLYYLKNIFLWGLGPIIAFLSVIGLFRMLRTKCQDCIPKFLFLIFYFFYFLIVGHSSVKFMRYMLPLYPFLAILAGFAIARLHKFNKILSAAVLIGVVFWTGIFMNIYAQPNTRVSATNWILKNIPAGSTLAIEHWDDRLPIFGGENYQYQEMTLYDQPDDDSKWAVLNDKLKKTDYIIIASNRLYVPLQKLADCKRYKVCYPKTAEYYRRLFDGQLGFKKVAEFLVTPLFINDQSADESFTVYDHPKIMIFKNSAR